MKYILYFCTLFFIISTLDAQIIKYDPRISQGYLVLNKLENTALWQVAISKRVYQKDGTFTDNVVDKIEISGVNYFKLKEEYYSSKENYVINVTAFDNSYNVVEKEGPVWISVCGGCGDNPYKNVKSWVCKGSTYAWEIKTWTGNNICYLDLNSYYKPYVDGSEFATPYYQYMSQIEYDNLCQQTLYLNSHYLISNCDNGIDNLRIIKKTNVQLSDNLKNKNGQSLTGTVYGVAKERGDWNGRYIATHHLSEDYPGQNIGWAINTINNYSEAFGQYNLPLLNCDAINGGDSPLDDINDSILYGSSSQEYALSCFSEIWASDYDDMFEYIDAIHSCNDVDEGDDDGGNIWPNDVTEIDICPINYAAQVITLKKSDLYNREGNFIGKPFKLDAGLYNLTLKFADNSQIPTIIDAKKPMYNYYELSNFLEASVFPVPIKGNQYSIHFKANAKIQFKYQLFDGNSKELYKTKFLLEKGHDKNHQIIPNIVLPKGTLIHRFEFEDGSFISINTTKE